MLTTLKLKEIQRLKSLDCKLLLLHVQARRYSIILCTNDTNDT